MTAALGIALGLFLPSFAAWSLLAGMLPTADHPIERIGRIAMSVIIGIGVSSLTAIAWLLLGGRFGSGYAVTDALLFALIGIYSWSRRLRNRIPSDLCSGAPRDPVFILWSFFAVVLIAAGCFILITWNNPSGEFDAWVIWNLRARFLLRAGDAWRDAFAAELGWSSTEYPLLIPLSIARLWSYAGETYLGPACISGAFTFAAPLILAGALAAITGPWIGATAGLLLIGTPGFISLGASQYADVPVAVYTLAAVTVLALTRQTERWPDRYGLFVAGFILGLTAWTKNEGLAAAFLVALIAMVFWLLDGGMSRVRRSIPMLALGMSAPAAAWIWFHWKLMPRLTGSLFLAKGSTTVMDRMLDAGRWIKAGRGMVVNLPGWCFGFPFLVLLIAICAGLKPLRLVRHEATWVAAGLYGIFYGVFLATNWDLEWQLRLAADRTLLQLWPVLLFALFGSVLEGAKRE